MSHLIYISEPKAIDPTLVTEHLKRADYQVVLGSSDFSGAIPEDCEVIFIRSGTKVDSSITARFPHLKAILRAGTGLDNVDTAYCLEHGIDIFNAPGANADAAAEYVVTMALYISRKLYLLEHNDG